jgi:hypothetical protein
MDIRKFFNKRLKTDHVIHAVDNDNQCKDLTEDNVCINFNTSSTPNIKGNTNDSFDIGNCLDNIPTNNYVIYSMLTNPWKPDSSYNFKDDVIAGKRPFLREWYNTYPWLAYSRSGKGALCKSCVLFKPAHSIIIKSFMNMLNLTLFRNGTARLWKSLVISCQLWTVKSKVSMFLSMKG